MSRETADHCLRVLRNSPSVKVLDLTGGAPELNREFRHLVKNARSMGIEVIDRCNLTVLLEPRQEGLAAFLRDHQVHIIASLPKGLFSSKRTSAKVKVTFKATEPQEGVMLLNDKVYKSFPQ